MKVLATTPIIKEPMTLPYRIVLWQSHKEFVTHMESFIGEKSSYCYGVL